MHVLYIIRQRPVRKLKKRLHRWAVGFLDGQDGFFEAALHHATRVTRMRYEDATALTPQALNRYDAVVINAKSGWPWTTDAAAALDALRGVERPLGLFLGYAQPEYMPNDALLDPFHVVFKREPFADLGRYSISARNAAKIVPTHLSNPMATMSHRLTSRNRTRPLKRYAWQVPDRFDVSFLGTVNHNRHRERISAWQAIKSSDVTAVGGLLPKPDFAPQTPADLVSTALPKAEYLDIMMHSRINLALEGIGPFTFRHLEQFWAGAFTLSTPNIRPLRLRAPLIEGQDYVAFDDPDDLMDKIRWYLDHEDERLTIARNGRAAYERLHDVNAHAQEIRRALDA